MAEIKDLLNPLYSYGLISGQASDSIRKYLEGNSAKGTSKPFTRGKTTNAYGDALTNKGRLDLNRINQEAYNKQRIGPANEGTSFRNSNMFIPSNTTVNQNSLLSSENTNSPFIQDIATAIGRGAELSNTGANLINKNYVDPALSYLTGGEYRYQDLDTTYDKQGAESVAVSKAGIKGITGEGGYYDDAYNWFQNLGKDFVKTRDDDGNRPPDAISGEPVTEGENKDLLFYMNKIQEKFDKDVSTNVINKDVDQVEISKTLKLASTETNSTGEISNASSILTDAVTTKDKTKTDKITGALNGFMDKLDSPGFQTALAMHMEAKNGGDITSVLFEGMKVKKKAKEDAMTAHKNNLIVKKAEFEIIDLINKAGKPEPASKNLTALATSFLTSGKYDLRSSDQATAVFTLTDYAKKLQTVNNRLTESEAFMEAVRIADKAGALTEDAFFDNPFNGLGGEFDATVELPTPGGKSVNLSALQKQADAQGISIVDAAEQARIAGYVVDQSR